MTGPQGELRLVGRLVEASNGTFLAEDDAGARWVYKPVAGEAPLWDFPPATLGRREVAAYVLSEELGLGLVPETALGRSFRDRAGWLNQSVASLAQRVILMVAGLPVIVKGEEETE